MPPFSKMIFVTPRKTWQGKQWAIKTAYVSLCLNCSNIPFEKLSKIAWGLAQNVRFFSFCRWSGGEGSQKKIPACVVAVQSDINRLSGIVCSVSVVLTDRLPQDSTQQKCPSAQTREWDCTARRSHSNNSHFCKKTKAFLTWKDYYLWEQCFPKG